MNRSTTIRRAAAAALLAGVALSTSGCALLANQYLGSGGGEPQPPSCGTWGVASAAPGTGGGQTGSRTALDAVVASGNTNGVPRDAWIPTTNGDESVTFTFGRTTVHVVKLTNGTWFADSGGTCGPQSAPASAAAGSTLELSIPPSPPAAP